MSYTNMRRKDREISEAEARKLLEQGTAGVLSMVDSEGQCYGVPLSYVVIDGEIAFHCALEGYKLDCIRHNNKVSFCVVGEHEAFYEKDYTTSFESVIAFGTIVEEQEEGRKKEILRAICQKYLPEHMEHFEEAMKSLKRTGVLRMTIAHITGKRRPHMRPEA